MKKRIALFLALVLLCLSFTGCTLEGMRRTHLKYDENGNIPFNGHTYIHLPDDRGILNFVIDYSETYYTTAPDVPLLWREDFGDYTRVSKDGNFLMVAVEYYCHSDIYEEMKQMLQDPSALEYFCIEPREFFDRYIMLTEEESLWLKGILENTEPTNELDRYYTEYIAQVYACSEDLLLQQELFDIRKMSTGFYFEQYNEKTESYDAIVLTPEDSAKLGDILERATFYGDTYVK